LAFTLAMRGRGGFGLELAGVVGVLLAVACAKPTGSPGSGRRPDAGALRGSAIEDSEALTQIHRDDQADRAAGAGKIDWGVVGPRDEARRKQVLAILDRGGATSALDYFHAAMVMQHGSALEDFKRAHDLAVKATELDPDLKQARWLAAAAQDRLLMNSGKPQLYGTQFVTRNGRWELYEVDPATTDEERARWNVPPLADAVKRAAEMNHD
jgi:hypothetical protein